MGLTHVTVSVANLAMDAAPFEGEFLVDTGAIDCLVPASKLLAAGVTVRGEDTYELANGKLVKYPYGLCIIGFMGAETVSKVVFAEENAEPLLGVVALESTGYGVDPITKTLKKMNAKPLK